MPGIMTTLPEQLLTLDEKNHFFFLAKPDARVLTPVGRP